MEQHVDRASSGKLTKCNGVVEINFKPPTGRFADENKDHYTTPAWAWGELFTAMPILLKRQLWDPFYCAGGTADAWTNLGVKEFKHGKGDFFKQIRRVKYDVIVTNPPFIKKQLVVATLVNTGKPFILLVRTNVLFTLWFRRMVPIFKLVLPSRQVNYTGMDGQLITFDSVFVCVRCGPKRSLHLCPRS
jgi:hypothetical protein